MALPNNAPLPSSFDENEDFFNEDRWSKILRRLREEPLVPLGCGVTVWAIINASRSMRKGDHSKTNLYFRRRLYAQAFTIAVLVAGNTYWADDRKKRKEYEKMVEQKEKAAKRERWLRELEIRDHEEKAWKERLGNLRKAPDESGISVAKALSKSAHESNNHD